MPKMKIRDRRSGFLWIANSVYDYYAPRVQPSTFMVYTALCRYADNADQTCHPSYEKIGEKLNLSRATVASALAELKELKLISWEKVGRHNEYSLLDCSTRLNFRPVENSEPTRLKNVTNQSNGLDTIKTYIKTQDQERTLLASQSSASDDFSLSSDDDGPQAKKKTKAADERHQPFRAKLEKFWRHLNSADMYWTPADAKQLADFLKHWPKLTLESFHAALVNYMESENIVASRLPYEFLPKLHLYFDAPLDKYGKPIADEERTVH